MRAGIVPLALLQLAAAAALAQEPRPSGIPAGPAETLYYNGKIITMWGERPVVESMTVASGRVLDVGITQVVGRKTGPRTRQVNLRGMTVLPGPVDSHLRPIAAGANGGNPLLRNFEAARAWADSGFKGDVELSLRPGRRADFLIVDRDVLACGEEELRQIRVVTAVLGGVELDAAAKRGEPE